MNKKISSSLIILFILIILISRITLAEHLKNSQNAHFSLQTSLMTSHWDKDPDTNNVQELIGLEYHLDNTQLYGLAYFKNSAFQSSWYLYKGRNFPWKQVNEFEFYGKLTYGVITGYDDEGGRYKAVWYELGTFPAVLPSIGIGYKHLSLELSLFANQGFMVHGGINF
ncbi:hypothetical protein [Halanaerobacter jeridensis]|uniref:Sn-glycerol-3-phosphate transporter n=1 Tax=Halanaerobacter jeridensis TaxID=706427 RepID=A0A938XSV6_9FIRM|nr:hypothetical protein [Halanaerobacter jeridensis]MBM7557101.1 hypothetical protein [Halanaerobacter jeridensis]